MFLARSLNIGGAERQLVYLAKGLRDLGNEVSVAVFYADGVLEKELQTAGIPIINLRKSGRWDVFQFFKRLSDIVKRTRPDVIYSFLGVPNILTVFIKPIFSEIKMVWGVRASNMDLIRYDWLTRLSYRIECFLSRYADLIICNSYAGMKYAIECGFPASKMMVISNGIDTDRFQPNMDARNLMRKKWGIGDSQFLIGLVGRLDPMKDHPNFIKAASILAGARQDVRFVCVGDGPEPYKTELKSIVDEMELSERFIWAGTVGDMPAVCNSLDIAVSSSSFGEGFPNVIGETMASQVPCVVTDVGDNALIVGDTGTVVSPGNPAELADSLNLCLNGDIRNMGALSRGRIIEYFNLQQLIEKTEKALLQIVSRTYQ